MGRPAALSVDLGEGFAPSQGSVPYMTVEGIGPKIKHTSLNLARLALCEELHTPASLNPSSNPMERCSH